MLSALKDTLSADTVILNRFRADEAYNYQRELKMPDLNWWDYIMGLLRSWFDAIAIKSTTDNNTYIYVVISIIFISILGYIIYKVKPQLFKRVDKVDFDMPDVDTIYGIDFDKELEIALKKQDYYQAVRMVYLRLLKWLSDNNKINWQLSKTPTAYTREFRSNDFLQMTLSFVEVRYGQEVATSKLVDELLNKEQTIKEGGQV